MKCQSEYGTEVDAILSQADVCVEDWWEGEPSRAAEPQAKGGEEELSTLIVEREVRKRGLHEANAQAGS
jgi:hypothetical protein